jgi:hypothetical protein
MSKVAVAMYLRPSCVGSGATCATCCFCLVKCVVVGGVLVLGAVVEWIRVFVYPLKCAADRMAAVGRLSSVTGCGYEL